MTFIDQQLAMFDGVSPAPSPRRHRCPTCRAGFAPVGRAQRIADRRAAADRDWSAAWDQEIDAFPEDELTILDCTRRLIAVSKRPIGMAKVWEELRGKVKVNLDNNYRAPCARRLMARHADLVGRISIRGDAGQTPERRR